MTRTLGAFKFGIGENFDQQNAKAIISNKRLSPGKSKSKADSYLEEMNNTFVGSWGIGILDNTSKF